ncbi:MAG: DUF4340 domain-containing protein, partial [Butyricicoccus sp.]|nr:DUF4340 domain-containing protein [Butyricicoccus sp.]
GDYNKHADAYYCDMGDGAVYLIDAAYLDAFDYTMKDLLQDELITKPKKGLSAVTAFKLAFRDGSGFTYTFTKTEADEAAESTDAAETAPAELWVKTLLDGTVVEGDFTKQAEALYKELFEAKLDAWADYNVTGAQRLGEFGLAEPAVTVTVRYTEEVTIAGDDSTSSVTKEVEKVVGFLIGDAAPSEKEDEPADSESSADTAAPETVGSTDAATDTEAPEGDAEEEEEIVNRYFMLDVARAIANADHEIALYTGNDDNIVIDLLTKFTFGEKTVRCVGGLLGHWAVWTKTAVDLFHEIKRIQKCDTVPASMISLAAMVTDANSAFFDVHNDFAGCIAGVHEVLFRQGLMKGIWCLNPNETLSPGQKEEIDRVYKLYPSLNDDEFVKEFLEKEPG